MFLHSSVPTSTTVEFVNFEPRSPLLSDAVVKVLYLGMNRNGSCFTKEVVNKMIPSLYGIPVVGKFDPRKGDFMGHEKQMKRGKNGLETVPLTIPYGYVPDNAKIWYQTFLDDDKVEREYLCCDVRLWTGRYPETFRILTQGNHQSMEIDPPTMTGEWTIADNDGAEYFMVNEAYFSALCILGQDVEPCFEGAGIAHEFSLTEEDKIFLFELDKAIAKVKGEYTMESVKEYMSVEDIKLMLQAGSGEPEVSHVQDGLPNGASITPADNIVSPAEGLATDANFEADEEKKEEVPPVSKEEGSEAGKELEQLGQEEKAGDVPPEPKKEEGEGGGEAPKAEEMPVPPMPEEVPNAMNPQVADGLDPVSKIDQIMMEDKDILETELLKKIIELLEGKMGAVPMPPVDNAGKPPVAPQAPPVEPAQPPVPPMPTEVPPQVEQIRRQYELEIAQEKANYEAEKAKNEALMDELCKLKEFKLQIEMNEKEKVIAEYSMLPQSVLDGLKEQAKVLSKPELEAQCALAFVKNSKKEIKENDMITYSYGQVPQNDFLQELELAINKTK
jgi:hypothetical protein